MASTDMQETAFSEAAGNVRAALAIVVLFAIVCLAWATTWLVIKFAVDTVPLACPFLAFSLPYYRLFSIDFGGHKIS
jgi:predicted metal-binding membrane protein